MELMFTYRKGVNPGMVLTLVNVGWVSRNRGHQEGYPSSAATPQNLSEPVTRATFRIPGNPSHNCALKPKTVLVSVGLLLSRDLKTCLPGAPSILGGGACVYSNKFLPSHLEGSKGLYGILHCLYCTLYWQVVVSCLSSLRNRVYKLHCNPHPNR